MRCYRCMKEFDKEYEICPHCGYINATDLIEPFQLPPGTMLQERYWIGVMIGYGGFGITYKAYDTKLHVTVAIKEYYPSGLVNRAGGNTELRNYSDDREQEFNSGLQHFIEEARNIARFSEHPNIVKVYHFFKENHTGYIVMEYLDGISMKYFLEVNGGKTSILYAKEIVLAIAQALQTLHKAGILHRDVSPDNIFLCSDGKIKLIDFGSSGLSKAEEYNREIIVKPGYSPPEQYDKNGVQGTWTDIYALGATFYRAVTGHVPVESKDRQQEDTMLRPNAYDSDIPAYIDSIILKAMAVERKDRFEKIEDFADALLKRKVVAIPKPMKKKQKNYLLAKLSMMLALLAVFGMLLWKYITIRQYHQYVAQPIDVWICAKEDEDPLVVQAYYQNITDKLLKYSDRDIVVDIHVEEESVYEEKLLEAFSQDDVPDLFDSTVLSESAMKNAGDLEECVEQLDAEYYFFDEYATYFADGKRIPIGFSMPVVYTLQPEEGVEVHLSLEDFADWNTYLGNDKQADEPKLNQFVNGEIPYLLGDLTDYPYIKNIIYGTFEEPKDTVKGILRICPLGDGQENITFTTTFSVNQSCLEEEKETAYIYLQYLLSYRGQVLLHTPQDGVVESAAFSIQEEADKEYRKMVEELLPVLTDTLQ